MALTKRVVPLVLNKGMDTSTDPKVLQDGLAVLENGHFDRSGAIVKRNGTVNIGNAASVGSNKHMGVHNDTPVAYGVDLYKYGGSSDPEAGSFAAISDKTGLCDVGVERFSHLSTDLLPGEVEVAESGNVRAFMYTWRDVSGYGLYVETFDLHSGVRLSSKNLQRKQANNFRGKLLVVGTKIFGYFAELIAFTGSNDVRRFEINTTTGSIGTDVTVGGSPPVPSTTNTAFDGCVVGEGPSSYAVYLMLINSADDPHFVHIADGDGTATWTNIGATTATSVGCFSYADDNTAPGDSAVLMWTQPNASNTEVYAMMRDSADSLIRGNDLIDTIADTNDVLGMTGVETTATATKIYYCHRNAEDKTEPVIRTNTYSESGGAGSASTFMTGAKLFCKPVRIDTTRHYTGIYNQVWLYGAASGQNLDSAGDPADTLVHSGTDGATNASNQFTSASATFLTSPILEAGDVLVINDTGTPGDNGTYTVTSVLTATTCLVDRNFPAGSLSSLTFEIWKSAQYDQCTYIWVDQNGDPVGKAHPGLARWHIGQVGSPGIRSLSTTNPTSDSNKFIVGAAYQGQESSDSTIITTGLPGGRSNSVITIDIDPTPDKTVEHNDSMLVTNSVPYLFDGQSVVESGYLMFPYARYALSAGAGNIANGNYRYQIIWEWVDANGRVHQSAPSIPLKAVVTGGPKSITLTLPTNDITRRDGTLGVVYRTQADGTTYYRVGATSTTSFTDNSSDDTISTKGLLYTTGGVLEHIHPPGTRTHAVHQNRHFVVDREKESSDIRYSKVGETGVSTEHNDSLVVQVPDEGGRITGLFSFVDKLIVFKENDIYAIEGEGLNALGIGSGFRRAYLVSSAVGCTEPRSIVRVPQGLMFQSSDGIYLLSTSLQAQPIGQRIRLEVNDKTISGAHVNPNKNIALFTLDQDAATDVPGAVVYNYLYDQWSRYDNYHATGSVFANGRTYFRSSSTNYDRVHVETTAFATRTTSTTDVYTPLRLQTGWISLAQIGGFKRVYEVLLVMQRISNSDLDIKVGYNYEANWLNAYSNNIVTDNFDYTEYYKTTPAVGTDNAYIIRFYPPRQKCTAIRFFISDTEDSGKTEGISISAVSLLVGLKPGGARVGKSRAYEAA